MHSSYHINDLKSEKEKCQYKKQSNQFMSFHFLIS